MDSFTYYLPVNVVFGRGKADCAGKLTAPFGRKALIVTGRSSAKKSGLYDRVRTSLSKAGVDSVLFDKVTSNPLTTTAVEGALFAISTGCDVVVGIGGGSIMDCAKGIAFLAANYGESTSDIAADKINSSDNNAKNCILPTAQSLQVALNDYIFGKKSSDSALPIILIPTTCGTGTEGNCFAVLTNPETGDKKSLRCNAIVAKVSIIDPDCMKTMPQKVLASVGFDALCHCMEAYTAGRAQPFTDALAEYAIPRIYESLPRLVDRHEEKNYNCPDCNCNSDAEEKDWENMALCSLIGGMVINTAGITLAHAMEHPVSGLKNVVHGQGLAALTPIAIEVSCDGAHDKFEKLALMLGGRNLGDCAAQIRKLLHKIHLEYTLSDLGVKESDIPWLASNCLKVSPANIQNNPVNFDEDQIAELYRRAL